MHELWVSGPHVVVVLSLRFRMFGGCRDQCYHVPLLLLHAVRLPSSEFQYVRHFCLSLVFKKLVTCEPLLANWSCAGC